MNETPTDQIDILNRWWHLEASDGAWKNLGQLVVSSIERCWSVDDVYSSRTQMFSGQVTFDIFLGGTVGYFPHKGDQSTLANPCQPLPTWKKLLDS